MLLSWLGARALGAVGVAVAIGVCLPALAASFKDPLDVPAKLSVKAPNTPMLAVTNAGKRLVALGWRGHIVYSDDAGASWSQAKVPVSVDLTELSFPTPMQGWAVGHAGVVLHTTDGGATWVRQIDGRGVAKVMTDYYKGRIDKGDASAEKYLREVELSWRDGPEQPWLGVHFLDEKRGWVVGAFNMVMFTQDGGASWTPMLDHVENPDGLHLNSITEIDGSLYLASERGIVFRKMPDSDRFMPMKSGYTGTFFGVCGHANNLLVYGLRGNVYRSVDRGVSWQSMESGSKTTFNGCVTTAQHSVLVSQGGEIFTTGQNPMTWVSASKPNVGPLYAVHSDESGSLVLAGVQGVRRLAAVKERP